MPSADPSLEVPDSPASPASAPGTPRAGADDSDQPPPGVSWKKSKATDSGKAKAKKDKDRRASGWDPYKLLGLQNERHTATDAQLKSGKGLKHTVLQCITFACELM